MASKSLLIRNAIRDALPKALEEGFEDRGAFNQRGLLSAVMENLDLDCVAALLWQDVMTQLEEDA